MYILSALFLFLAFFVGKYFLGSNLSLLSLVDIPSFVIMAFITFGSLVAGRKLKAVKDAFATAFSRNENTIYDHTDSELSNGQSAIAYLIYSVWCAGVISALFGMIAFLNGLNNSDKNIVTTLATSLCSPLYASVVHILLLPVKARLERK